MTTLTPPTSSAPPVAQTGAIAWLRKNLFSSWGNTILTIVIVALLARMLIGFAIWSTTKAQWQVIPTNLPLFMVGLYPADQYWRMWLMFGLIATMAGLSWGVLTRNISRLFSRPVLIGIAIAAIIAILLPTTPLNRLLVVGSIALVAIGAWVGRLLARRAPVLGQWLPLGWFLVFLLSLWLIRGGFGLETVSTSNWGGLMLTLFLSVVSIALCFPIGVLLALGRRSDLPVVRWLSTLYIELIRGVPLIAILFMGQVMIPLFLPPGARPDRILRAIVGLTLFSAAYLAENVRGGLQAVPRGQREAAQALGLNPLLTTGLIVLPQALKISIPAIVGQFISLVQDTTLLSIVGLVELLGISRSILANPQFLGRYAEVYLFVAVIFWVFCYAMSQGSRQLEKRLNTDHR